MNRCKTLNIVLYLDHALPIKKRNISQLKLKIWKYRNKTSQKSLLRERVSLTRSTGPHFRILS